MLPDDGVRSPRQRRIVATAVILTVLLFASSCGSSDDDATGSDDTAASEQDATAGLPDEGAPTEGGKLVMAVTAETNGWNPALAQWADAGQFVGSSFLEPLFVFDNDENLAPWLARDAVPNEDFTQWTIRIREGVMFHDGTEFKASDSVAGIRLAIDEGLSGIALGDLFGETRVLDDYTFQVDVTEPWAAFPNTLAGPLGYAMAPSMLNSDDKGIDSPVGTGAYAFENWRPDDNLTVRRFDDYWGGPCFAGDPEPGIQRAIESLCGEIGVPMGQRNGPFLDAMEFRPIPDAQQRANALQSGDVNLILTNLAVDAARLKEDYQVVPDYNAEKTFVALNTAQPPFDNINARRALALATDRAKIVEQVAAGEPVVSDTSPFSEVSKWGGLAPDQTGYPAYDPAAAREAVAAYTAETGQPLTFTLSGLPPVEEREVLQSLQAMWREVGIEAQVETIEQTAYIIKLTQGDFQAAYYRNYAYPDPDQNHVFWSADTMGGSIILNFNQYTSETTENALRLGRLSTNFEERAAAYEKLVLDRNAAVVDLWLFNTPYALIGDENIRGLNWFRQLPFGNFMPKPYLTGVWLQR